jgi:hypothetical protein
VLLHGDGQHASNLERREAGKAQLGRRHIDGHAKVVAPPIALHHRPLDMAMQSAAGIGGEHGRQMLGPRLTGAAERHPLGRRTVRLAHAQRPLPGV